MPLLILLDIFRAIREYHHIEFILGLITVIAFLVLASTASNKAYETSGSNVNFTTFFGSGYFLTAVFSFVGIFFFTSKNEEEQEDEPTTQKKEIGAPIHKTQAKQETQVSEDKTTLYNQLEHILRLKQNELISEEQFEKEKQQIHEKLFGIEKKEVEKKPVVVPIADATPKVVAEPIKTVPKRIPIEPEENPNKPLYIVFGISLGLMACVIYYLMPYDKANDTNINNVENTISSYELNGKLCYPSDYIPSMVVYLKEINTNQTYTLATKQNQKQFSFANIPLGNYFAYAYTVDKAHGGYTNAVPCGLSYECQDHSLINIELKGQPFHDTISICDWYGSNRST